jgi:hypothetical protein
VTNAPVAVDLLEALEVELKVPAEVTFDGDAVGLNDRNDDPDLLVGQFTRAGVRVDVRLAEDLLRERKADAIDVRERSFDALLIGDINAEESCHIVAGGERILVALTLFMARVFADDANHTLPANDAAGFTKFFYGRTDFHGKTRRVGGFIPLTPAGLEIVGEPVGETKTPLRALKGSEAGGDP